MIAMLTASAVGPLVGIAMAVIPGAGGGTPDPVPAPEPAVVSAATEQQAADARAEQRRIAESAAQEARRIVAAQERLDGLGYFPGPADGVMGPRTEAAVRAFQAANGLDVDGVYGPATESALADPDARRYVPPPPEPAPEPEAEPAPEPEPEPAKPKPEPETAAVDPSAYIPGHLLAKYGSVDWAWRPSDGDPSYVRCDYWGEGVLDMATREVTVDPATVTCDDDYTMLSAADQQYLALHEFAHHVQMMLWRTGLDEQEADCLARLWGATTTHYGCDDMAGARALLAE